MNLTIATDDETERILERYENKSEAAREAIKAYLGDGEDEEDAKGALSDEERKALDLLDTLAVEGAVDKRVAITKLAQNLGLDKELVFRAVVGRLIKEGWVTHQQGWDDEGALIVHEEPVEGRTNGEDGANKELLPHQRRTEAETGCTPSTHIWLSDGRCGRCGAERPSKAEDEPEPNEIVADGSGEEIEDYSPSSADRRECEICGTKIPIHGPDHCEACREEGGR